MLFNSFEFATFFFIVYLLYAALSHRNRVRMLLAASYVFYGSWDWRFLSLIVFSTVLDFWVGQRIHDSQDEGRRKRLLLLSLVGNLGVLGFFKYFNFFTDSFVSLLSVLGFSQEPPHLGILLPVGLSFYTFQTLSYTISIHRRQIEPTRRLVDFALFVSFFPQLVAGPIERARRLLPQITTPRPLTLSNLYEGAYLIGWGLFLKVFAADNLAKIVGPVFNAEGPYAPATVVVALVSFSIQIFCDFAGYSSIARGTAKCLGFDLMVNFDAPYLSPNPSEFWRRWHISLSSWLRDYLYIPLGGNRSGRWMTHRNLLLTMLLGGLWHGAAWTFVLWGAYHGVLLIGHRMLKAVFERLPKIQNAAWRAASYGIRVCCFFALVSFGWITFRATSVDQSLAMTACLFEGSWNLTGEDIHDLGLLFFYSAIPMLMHAVQYRTGTPLAMLRAPVPVRVLFYLVCLYMLLIFGVSGGQEFIYFQF